MIRQKRRRRCAVLERCSRHRVSLPHMEHSRHKPQAGPLVTLPAKLQVMVHRALGARAAAAPKRSARRGRRSEAGAVSTDAVLDSCENVYLVAIRACASHSELLRARRRSGCVRYDYCRRRRCKPVDFTSALPQQRPQCLDTGRWAAGKCCNMAKSAAWKGHAPAVVPRTLGVQELSHSN